MYFELAVPALLGFLIYHLFTHPKLLKRKLPKVKVGSIQILPNFRIKLKARTILIHHWILMAATLGFLNHFAKGLENLIMVKLFAFGGLIQGLTFRDRFNFFWNKPKRNLRVRYKISVIIPAHNEERSIRKALSALKCQTYKPKEVIVVDNASTDKTAEIAKKFGAKVIYEPRRGVAYACQAGFGAARGQIIATTDADSIVPKSWLSTIAYEFANRQDAVAIAGMYEFYDGSVLLRFLTWLFNYPIFTIFGWYSGANMAIRRDIFIKSGGFNTSLKLGEDSNLMVRVKKFGKVYRLANFKVKTSARRFNKLGLLMGLFDYCYNYIKFKLTKKDNFRAVSEVPELSLASRVAIQVTITSLILVAILAGLFEINPVKAEVVKRGHQLAGQIKKFDREIPTITHSYQNLKYKSQFHRSPSPWH